MQLFLLWLRDFSSKVRGGNKQMQTFQNEKLKMSGKAKSWQYLPPWQQPEIHIHTVDLYLMLVLSLVTSGDCSGVLPLNSHDTTFEKVGGQFPLLLSETVIKRKKKISLKQPWPSQITYCTICNRPWDLGQRKGFWNLLFVFGFPSNNISERDCTYFLGASTVFCTLKKKLHFFSQFQIL